MSNDKLTMGPVQVNTDSWSEPDKLVVGRITNVTMGGPGEIRAMNIKGGSVSVRGDVLKAYTIQPSIAMVPTMELRYSKTTGQLQQRWYDYFGSGKEEWRNIEVEK